MSRVGNIRDTSAMESFFSSLKTERTTRMVDRTRDEARADVFDYIVRFYDPRRRHSNPGDPSPVAFEDRALQIQPGVLETGKRPEGTRSLTVLILTGICCNVSRSCRRYASRVVGLQSFVRDRVIDRPKG